MSEGSGPGADAIEKKVVPDRDQAGRAGRLDHRCHRSNRESLVIKLQVLDVTQRIGAVGTAGTQIDNLPATIRVLRYLIISRRPGIDRRIATAATINSVVAGAPVSVRCRLVARERVVEGAADDVLDTAENVPLCIAARAEAGEEVHAHCGGGRGVVRRIHSRAADQRVGARAALERVVPRPTEQHVVSAQPTKNVRLIG